MIERILVAADDTPGGLAAVRAAVAIAASEGARLLAVHVLVDGVLERELTALGSEPDVIVVARAARHTTGHPYVGSQTRHVLEFAEQPVLVVPQPPR